MSIRLNKAIRELNIGLQTAVEFLEKRQELGEVKGDPNFKLSDDQFKALEKEFKPDQVVKNDAAKIFQKKQKDKVRTKKTSEHKTEKLAKQETPKIKMLGKIDLEQLSKPTTKVSVASKEKKSRKNEAEINKQVEKEKKTEITSSKEKEAVEVKSAVKEKVEELPNQTITKEKSKKVEEFQKTDISTSETLKKEPMVEKEKEEKRNKKEMTAEDNGIFQTSNEKKMLNQPKVNILGKIDLSSINQSTRPKKKTKEERRKEREDKSAQNVQGKKKRVRINKERVDINAAANQQQPGKRNGKKNNNDNYGKNATGGKKKHNRNQKPLEVDDEAVARQVKETLARLTSKSQNKKGAKYRKEKREAVQERLSAEAKAERKESKTLKLTEFVTVSELATMMNLPVTQVISTLMSVGIMVSINQRLDAETINLVADEFGFKTEYVSAEVQEAISEEADEETDLVSRAPIVTVMGHVDHGKTSLLDHIRNTNVIAGEAGGITQHIGAYSVTLKSGRKVTFLDTPGHEAFTAMRARGTQVTDIAIIIIAADDSVMPTTKEAIAHAQAAGVPMVFAINKIDKPGANPDKIREDLSQMNLLVEEWGGKYQCQEISAKKGLGVADLLDKVLLEADMLDLKANPNRNATGTVIESSLDKGRGYVSTVLVSNGTLKVGDNMIAGTSWGRIKAMFNERNQRVEKAGPSEPVIILGLNGAPTAGDTFHVMETEQEARDIANKREQLQREQGLRTQTRLTLSDISHRIARGEFHEMNIIVKGDTDGSIEALADSFIKLSTEKVNVNVISKAVGQISENDVMLAAASDAVIVGFQVRPSADARKLADRDGVEINTYSVIYDAIDDVTSAMVGMLDKVKKEIVTGQVEVQQVFKISKVGTVAGCIVTEGKVHSKDKGRVIRDGIVIHTAPISALKRYKDDVKEVVTGLECGISLVNYNDLQTGDMIETFTEIEVEQKL
ncbi:translation initiation factor IF-2 [Prevotella nigrescens]|jgi:translation initiation factor IF-2|uniref:translation initiation factor IF-2 n=1 Tax=Prevotella nigrescens TaxID=28133 RepID=UPI0002184117|nr:translation initiation factor IF-2 [Prevotella nigrescens]EGQ13358.1 translation initiation factor IF-2 [Prevotella nigrescens ATCC 33563]MBW4726446.1 translation initiation factor IF-2 [Prevotella nigrescens]OWP31035.1 translation initiation factor IF-2 [Prevotella nigrescens]UAK28643.1 translation initiation factor IF-2 [Prevotella nigrescens]WMS22248.1 translation initiation factor IF-2 [Prevotella nigrescens]